MKNKFILGFLLFISIILVTNGYSILTSKDIKLLTDKGYILSDNLVTYSECDSIKEKYNKEYPNYKRSECFNDRVGYKYFICQLTDSCNLGGVGTKSSLLNSSSGSNSQISSTGSSLSNSSSGSAIVIPNKEKLDKFLEKVRSMEADLSLEKYESTINSLILKINILGSKYSTNPTIKSMVGYLKSGLIEIKDDLSQRIDAIAKKRDIDNFFCDLIDGCNQTGTGTQNVIK